MSFLTWMTKKSRKPFALAVFVVVALLSFGAYLQAYQGIVPCPLCVLQRMLFALFGVIMLAAFLHNPKRLGRALYYLLGSIAAIVGAAVAGRHLWIEHLPAELVPSCGPSWDVLVENFPWHEVLTIALRGSGDCHAVTWHFGLSIAGWSLVWFILLAIFAFIGLGVSMRADVTR